MFLTRLDLEKIVWLDRTPGTLCHAPHRQTTHLLLFRADYEPRPITQRIRAQIGSCCPVSFYTSYSESSLVSPLREQLFFPLLPLGFIPVPTVGETFQFRPDVHSEIRCALFLSPAVRTRYRSLAP